jgi:hypothetical protein
MSWYILLVNSSSALDNDPSCHVDSRLEGGIVESDCVGGLMVAGVSVKVSGGRDSTEEDSSCGEVWSGSSMAFWWFGVSVMNPWESEEKDVSFSMYFNPRYYCIHFAGRRYLGIR